MIQKLKRQILVLASVLMFALPVMAPVAVYAAGRGGGGAAGCTGNITSGLANGASAASGTDVDCNESGTGDGGTINALAQKVVNIFSILVGGVAVIMIIYGGFRYITSGGDSGNVGNAKNTLIYAVVGLVVVALAQIIVHFVLAQTTTASTGL